MPTENLTMLTVSNTRDMRFCEILVVKPTGIEIYNTTGVSECSSDLWNALDLDSIRQQYGALKIIKNGPHFWMMDEQTVAFGEEAMFGSIAARWVGRLDSQMMQAAAAGVVPYTVFMPKKTQKMVYGKGKPVYDLVFPVGIVFFLRPHDERSRADGLDQLEKRLKLPTGWHFRKGFL